MALTAGSAAAGSGLAGQIKSLVLAKNPQLSSQVEAGTDMDWLFDAIAEAVTSHITSKLEVTTQVDPATNIGTSTVIL